jgi:hypothetical protein
MPYDSARASSRLQPGSQGESLAHGLGIFSLVLGAAEVLAPQTLARALGMTGSESLIAGYGLREIATGIGILTAEDPTNWIRGRVAGDALDLVTLAAGLRGDNPQRGNVVIAVAAVAGVTALDIGCVQALSRERMPSLPPPDYSDRSGLPRPPEEMRGAARDFTAPRDMRTPEALRPFSA